MISWRARTHQQCDSAPLLTYRTKQGKSGTRRSPDLTGRLTYAQYLKLVMPESAQPDEE